MVEFKGHAQIWMWTQHNDSRLFLGELVLIWEGIAHQGCFKDLGWYVPPHELCLFRGLTLDLIFNILEVKVTRKGANSQQ